MNNRRTMEALLTEHGRTFADEAGIRLRDTPSPCISCWCSVTS